jgi:transglutaminase-like putative cysteine protease
MTADRRMTVTVAIACVLTSTVLYPLFYGAQWFYLGIGAVLAVAASGTLSRLRTLPVAVCLGISLLGLLLYLNLAFEARYSLLRVIPTPTSIIRLGDLVGAGMTDASKYAPPAHYRPDLVLLAVGGIGLTAVMADLIAVRLGSTALAGLPLLVLFTVPITMRAPSGVGTVIVFCVGAAGYLAMLSADGRERIRVWGRLVSLWRSGPHDDVAARRRAGELEPGPDTRALAAAGRRVGLASVVLALCIPLIVPGLHPSKLFSTGPGIGGTGGTAPALALPDTLSLSQTLKNQETRPTTVLSYTINPQVDPLPYLRDVVYDNLMSSGWETSDYAAGDSQATTLQTAEGLSDPSLYQQVTVTVHVINEGALSGPSVPTFLAVPYPPRSVSTPPGTWLSDPQLMVFSQDADVPVTTYTATSYVVNPSPKQLNEARPPPASLAVPDLQLPPSYSQNAALRRIAEQHTKGQTTEYAKIIALTTWLSSKPFTYDAAASGFDTADALLQFLTKTHAGVCVQYAYALTVLARLVGIPARLAGGFTAGTRTSPGHYVVKTNDEHAWTEAYFSDYGWLQFDATPSGGDGTAQARPYQTKPGTNLGGGSVTPVVQPSAGASTGPHSHPLPGSAQHPQLGDNGGADNGASAKPGGAPWGAVALAVIAAIALACGVIAIVAPPAQRALSFHPAEGRRRRPPSLTTAGLVAAVAAIVGLALYRLLSRASGLDLRAGWAIAGIVFGAACVVMLVAPAAIRIGLRWWRWMVASDDASRAHIAWREFRDDLADFGVGCRPSEPPRTLAERISTGLPEPTCDAIRRLALAEERATYAARPLDARNLRRDGTAARRGLRASVRRGARWRARIFPVSVMTALADGAAVIPDRLAALLSRRWTVRRSAS